MPDALARMPRMRGFNASVAREQSPRARLQVGAIRVGVDREGGEVRLRIELTHADGTILTGHLCDEGASKLADILGEEMNIVGIATHDGSETVQ